MTRMRERQEYDLRGKDEDLTQEQPENIARSSNSSWATNLRRTGFEYRFDRDLNQHAGAAEDRKSREMLEAHERVAVWEPIANELMHTDPGHRAMAETQMLQMIPDPATRGLVQSARQGEFPKDTLDRFYHPDGTTFQFDPHSDTPHERQLANFATELKSDIRSAAHGALDDIPWSVGLDAPQYIERQLHSHAMRNVMETVLEQCPWHPPAELGHPNPAVNQAWENQQSQAEKFMNDPATVPIMLKIRHDEAARYQATGELPNGIDPADFKPEATTVSPELEALGYSTMHNQPVDIFDQPENIENYLKRQMNAHVSHHSHASLGAHPAEFGKALLKPELEPLLAANWEIKFDPGNRYYTDDGLINYIEHEHVRSLTQDSANPLHHLQATYGRMVRDALMNKGIAEDAYMNRPEALAMSYPRNVLALRRMAAVSHNMLDQHQQETWKEPEMPGYSPVVNWNSTPEEMVETLNPDTLKEAHRACGKMIESLDGHFDVQDNVDHDSPMKIYSFIPQPDDPGDRDVDHPAAILLREAVQDIFHAQGLLSQAREEEILSGLEWAMAQGNPQQYLEQLRRDQEHWSVIHSAERIINEDDRQEERAILGNLPDFSSPAEEEYDEDRQDLRSTDQKLHQALATAAERLAHADFCLKLAKHARA